mmetsp:Transcript_40130/g.123990  ORF Transcript_40130/g.123990 Transcript_40130/m.123990 type:complete len:277 (-) Transcript_40130:321-1151(-)
MAAMPGPIATDDARAFIRSTVMWKTLEDPDTPRASTIPCRSARRCVNALPSKSGLGSRSCFATSDAAPGNFAWTVGSSSSKAAPCSSASHNCAHIALKASATPSLSSALRSSRRHRAARATISVKMSRRTGSHATGTWLRRMASSATLTPIGFIRSATSASADGGGFVTSSFARRGIVSLHTRCAHCAVCSRSFGPIVPPNVTKAPGDTGLPYAATASGRRKSVCALVMGDPRAGGKCGKKPRTVSRYSRPSPPSNADAVGGPTFSTVFPLSSAQS